MIGLLPISNNGLVFLMTLQIFDPYHHKELLLSLNKTIISFIYNVI